MLWFLVVVVVVVVDVVLVVLALDVVVLLLFPTCFVAWSSLVTSTWVGMFPIAPSLMREYHSIFQVPSLFNV
jgi:hypothetical protein